MSRVLASDLVIEFQELDTNARDLRASDTVEPVMLSGPVQLKHRGDRIAKRHGLSFYEDQLAEAEERIFAAEENLVDAEERAYSEYHDPEWRQGLARDLEVIQRRYQEVLEVSKERGRLLLDLQADDPSLEFDYPPSPRRLLPSDIRYLTGYAADDTQAGTEHREVDDTSVALELQMRDGHGTGSSTGKRIMVACVVRCCL